MQASETSGIQNPQRNSLSLVHLVSLLLPCSHVSPMVLEAPPPYRPCTPWIAAGDTSQTSWLDCAHAEWKLGAVAFILALLKMKWEVLLGGVEEDGILETQDLIHRNKAFHDALFSLEILIPLALQDSHFH